MAAGLLGCSANGSSPATSSGSGSGTDGGVPEAGAQCGQCFGGNYTPCNADGTPGQSVSCDGKVCVVGLGCAKCAPGAELCVGNEVHKCGSDGMSSDEVVQVCDVAHGDLCADGKCGAACDLAAEQASNVGCEFWAVQLDQIDYLGNDPVDMPWGVVLSNASQTEANVTIEQNDAPQGQPLSTVAIQQVTVAPGQLQVALLPVRPLDCGVKHNDPAAPGTCLSSQAFRIKSSSPIVVYQYNVFPNSWSNDASLLLPTSALGKIYRVIGWQAGHPVSVPQFNTPVDRSYVTVVGTTDNTHVAVRPSWRIRGNPPIAATGPGGQIDVTIGPFDVLNLETDDGTMQDPKETVTDLSATIVESDKPVAVFTGVETAGAPGWVDVPTPGGYPVGTPCCLDHLEEQMFPVESVGTHYVIARSPVRSTSTFREPDVIRFLGVAETANVTTSLPPPYDSFTIQPGEVKTTWTQDNFVAESDKPIMIGQILVSQAWVDGPSIGDPSLTVFPPVEQYRTEYVMLAPSSPAPYVPWLQHWFVISAQTGTDVLLDGQTTAACHTEPAGTVQGVSYETRWCPVQEGPHNLSGTKPFGATVYGYGSAGSYAAAGGADVKHIYDPPPLK